MKKPTKVGFWVEFDDGSRKENIFDASKVRADGVSFSIDSHTVTDVDYLTPYGRPTILYTDWDVRFRAAEYYQSPEEANQADQERRGL